MRVMMAFCHCFSVIFRFLSNFLCLLSFRSFDDSNKFCFNLIFLAFVWKCASILRSLQSADNSRQFPSQLRQIKWLTDNIGLTASFAPPSRPQLYKNLSLTLCYMLHLGLLFRRLLHCCSLPQRCLLEHAVRANLQQMQGTFPGRTAVSLH